MQTRTDLALERTEGLSPQAGIFIRHRGTAFRITEIEIDSDEHGAAIGKGMGRYLTLETAQLRHAVPQLRTQAAELAAELKRLRESKRKLEDEEIVRRVRAAAKDGGDIDEFLDSLECEKEDEHSNNAFRGADKSGSEVAPR